MRAETGFGIPARAFKLGFLETTMPILRAEPQMFPETLLDLPSEGEPGQWWLLYTLARKEKQLCRALLAKEIPFFCPTVPHRFRSPAGRIRTSHLPLFSSYVFLRGTEDDRSESLTTSCVSRCTVVADPDRLVHDLRQIKRLLDGGAPITIEDQLQPGMLVRVKSGPFRGVEGRVLERRTGKRLVVAVNFIQRGASIELGDWELEPLA